MKEQNTAKICREQLTDIVGNGDIELKGIDMEQVTLYIRMNKNLTSNLGKLWKYLPCRKKRGGVCVFIPSPVRVGTLLSEVPGTPIGASFFRI